MRRAAFTLTEVLLAIALIAAMAGFVAAGTGLFSKDALLARAPERVFISALKTAKIEAATRGRKMSLALESGAIVLRDASDKSEAAKFALPSDETFRAGLIPQYPETVGRESADFPDVPLDSIEVGADGTCTPASAVFRFGDETPATVKIDPLCAEATGIEK